MPLLNNDVLQYLFKKITEEPDGCSILNVCALLNREWRNIATPYLYKDPWKYWLYQCKDEHIAKQLINTYVMCYNAIERGHDWKHNHGGASEEVRPAKRRATTVHHEDNYKIPSCDYISLAKNLHVPSLYQSIKIWYKHNNNIDHDDENIQPIYDLFLKIFELFVDRAHIKYCTFAESTDDDNYPVTFDPLSRLINNGRLVDLKYLNLGFFQCDSNDLSKITQRCNNLKTFKISAQNCSDEALANFMRSQRCLTKLKIRNAEKINLTLEALGSQSNSLVKLRILSSNLESCQAPFNGIATCSNLRSIYMRKIINWPLNVSPSILLMPVATNCVFHNVDFSYTYLPVDILVEIAKRSSTTLRKVHLVRPENQIDQECYDLSTGIKALATNAKNIVYFERDIVPREIDAMIHFLNAMGNSLTRLEIESRSMFDADSSELISSISNCPNLEVLNIGFFKFNSQSFERLITNCRLLTTLSICNSIAVNDTILNIIRENYNEEKLKTLEIFACGEVSEDAIEQLRAETDIEVIWP